MFRRAPSSASGAAHARGCSKGDEGKAISVTANAASLKGLLNPVWLVANEPAIELLSAHFGFNALELQLGVAAADPADRASLEAGLAALVQVAGADGAVYEQLAQHLVARKKQEDDVGRNRAMGLAVQEAVRAALECRGLHLELIDHGYDYDVSIPDADVLLDGASRLQIGSWMMEVKATTSGEVRMTPAQVERANGEPGRYLLCVVDLRGLAVEGRGGPWTPFIVEPRATIFPGIGLAVTPTCSLVSAAVASEVAIRNESVLRYSVPVSVWSSGMPLDAWVNSLALPG